jgi:hypothetical protein
MRISGQKIVQRLTADDPRFSAALQERIAKMRRLLAAMEPESTAALLRALRQVFPDIPLDERVRAMSDVRH